MSIYEYQCWHSIKPADEWTLPEPTEDQIKELEDWISKKFHPAAGEKSICEAPKFYDFYSVGRYDIKFNNPFSGGLRKDLAPNYRFFKTEKDALNFIKESRYPVYRMFVFEKIYPVTANWVIMKPANSNEPFNIVKVPVVMYYPTKKLSWLDTKIQYMVGKFENPPNFLKNILRKKLAG